MGIASRPGERSPMTIGNKAHATFVLALLTGLAGAAARGAEDGRLPESYYSGPAAERARQLWSEEFRVRRQPIFDFTSDPKVEQHGDRTTIRFTTRGYCDVTVAIENTDGRILRHLASGVLGANAPAPFQANSLAQTIVWDGKNDQGTYLDDRDELVVRVSLGLRPRYERNLLWSPHRRIGSYPPSICARPEGVYVFDSLGVDHLRLFDHAGDYIRTIYPFPRNQLANVVGLDLRRLPQTGTILPVRHGFVQGSLLSSGTSAMDSAEKHHGGLGATTMAIIGEQIALAYRLLNRLATDGSTPRRGPGQARLPLTGPEVGVIKRFRRGSRLIGPFSSAFSPDGRWLYLTGYNYSQVYPGSASSYHGVRRIDYATGAKAELFAGVMSEGSHGTDNKHFRVPTSVACDSKGRVYVSDFGNDRIQVFSPAGKHLKTIRTTKPTQVLVNKRNGEIWAFSWPAVGMSHEVHRRIGYDPRKHVPTVTRFGPYKDPRRIAMWPFPMGRLDSGMVSTGQSVRVELDSWVDVPTVWVVGRKHRVDRAEVVYWGQGTLIREAADRWMTHGIRIFKLEGGKWRAQRNFSEDARRAIRRVQPPSFSRQRLYFNPRNRMLYVAHDSGFGKSFNQLIQVDPESGRVRLVDLPFDAEDMCFDINGLAYLRTDTIVVRYDSETWREVPWDYGEERPSVYFSSIGGGKHTPVISGLPTPGHRPVCWHQGGMSISPRGYLAVSCCSRSTPRKQSGGIRFRVTDIHGGKVYTPQLYPGRARWQEVHIWDKHGKLVHEDCIPGVTQLGGCEIDNAGNLYVLADSTRAYNGMRYPNEMTGTVMKFRPKKGKVVSVGRGVIPLSKAARLKRPVDVRGGSTGAAWVNGVEWMYGGAGWFGFNTARAGGGCDCWHSRFCIDYFARSFVPEVGHYTVAVLDKNGNVILRVGQYGNADDGVPLVKATAAPNARAIGNDEVALFHAAYVGTHTDRRLFIHDAGNARVISVKLGYHTTRRIPLRNVPDQKD